MDDVAADVDANDEVDGPHRGVSGGKCDHSRIGAWESGRFHFSGIVTGGINDQRAVVGSTTAREH